MYVTFVEQPTNQKITTKSAQKNTQSQASVTAVTTNASTAATQATTAEMADAQLRNSTSHSPSAKGLDSKTKVKNKLK